MLRCLFIVVTALLFAVTAQSAEDYRQVVVAEPYLEMHTGPGRGYPVFHVVERGAQVAVIKQRTDWYLVREPRGREGWVPEQQLLTTLELDGSPVDLDRSTLADLPKARWQGGMMFGDFAGASLISLYGSRGLSDHLAVGLTVSHALGNIWNAELATVDLTHTVLPAARLSPYLGIGAGMIHISPHTTQIQAVDSTDQLSYVGVGARLYLSRRFMARAEYRANYTYTSRDQNEEINEWKIGFAFFF